MNFPAGAAPTAPVAGDVFAISGPDSHLQFIDQLNAVQEIAFMSDVTAANGAVAAETARATAAEAALSTDISNETSRATTAESNLSGLITAETTRAEGAESTLTASIASEVSRATLAESNLSGAISTETTRAEAAEAAEVSRATAAELTKANIDGGNTFTGGSQNLAASTTAYPSANVATGAIPAPLHAGDIFLTSADLHLQFVDTTLTAQSLAFLADVQSANASVAAETARATAAEAALSTDISNETTRAEGAESAENSRALAAESNLSGLITAETTRAEGVESGLGASITAEISRATSAESTLSGLITAETGRAEAAEATKANIDGGNIFTNGKQTLAVSTTGAASLNFPAGAAPTAPVAGDVFAISGPDSHLQFIDQLNAVQEIAFMSDVTAANGAVAAETARATAAEAALSTDISNETSRATTAESNLNGLITAETTRAEGAESTLTASIASEVSRATLAESNLSGAISTETTRAEAAEAAEVSRATAAELTKANIDGGNTFTGGSQNLAASTTAYPAANVATGAIPAPLHAGDIFLTSADLHLQFVDTTLTAQSLAFLADVQSANASVAAETARATAAEAALSTDISNETTRAEGAESAENSRALAAESNLSGLITAETTRAEGVESGLGASITAEISRATSAESTLSGLITAETGRAEAAEATKANIDGGNIFTNGKQTLAVSTTGAASLNFPAGAAPTAPVAGDVFAISGPDSHLQFIDQLNAVQEIAFMSDVTAANGAVAAETARATAAEAALSTDISNETTRAEGAESAENTRAVAAESNLSGLIAAETSRATLAEGNLSGAITTETSRAEAAEAAELARATAAEATKANITGGNVFLGGSQVMAASTNAYSSFNVPTGAAPGTPILGDVWLTTGDTHLQFQASSGTQSIAYLSDVAASTLTAGTGISIVGNAINNTGVLSFNGRNGAVLPASGDYSFGGHHRHHYPGASFRRHLRHRHLRQRRDGHLSHLGHVGHRPGRRRTNHRRHRRQRRKRHGYRGSRQRWHGD